MLSAADLELAFVREFQALGERISGAVSTLEKRERVRLAIYAQHRAELSFPADRSMTYAEAYRAWAGAPLERRQSVRRQFVETTAERTDDLDEQQPAGA